MSLYADRGLHITRFAIQRLSGTTWTTVSTYQPTHWHRLRMHFQNFNHTNTLIDVVQIQVAFRLPFARFEQMENHPYLMLTNHDNSSTHLLSVQNGIFYERIRPGDGRWFNFGTFKWTGPTASMSQFPVEVWTLHWERRPMPDAPKAMLVATG
jgi:hypothetical protein